VIEIKNLNFHYSRKHQVYKNLNLKIDEGAVYALLGLNGAGKTTLLNLIAGFLIPAGGSCKVFNYEASQRKPEMLKEIFLVGDTSEFPNITVKEFHNLYVGFYPKFDSDLFNHCINEFGLNTQASLKRLSFGDSRKVILSFALATKCRLLLFDEPTNGLDIPSKSIFRKLIAANLGEEQTLVMATHQVRDLSNLMDRIIIEHQGNILLNESVENIAQKLTFGLAPGKIAKDDLLYETDSFKQNETISFNRTNQFGQVDIELLFTACTNYPHKFIKIFNL